MVWDVVSMEPYSTVLLASDSIFLYWVYAMKTAEQVPSLLTPLEKTKQHAVYLQILTLEVSSTVAASFTITCLYYLQCSEGVWSVSRQGKPLLLMRALQEDRSNSDVVKALMRAGPSYALTTLLGGAGKDDTCGCGYVV